MAIGLVIFDGEDKLSAVSLDATADSIMEFVEDFYFAGNPNFSVKNAWNQILKNFNLHMALAIANVMCRTMVLERSQVSAGMKRALRDVMVREGIEICSLDSDETERLFDKNYTYLYRIFNHQGVQSVAHDFADTLKRVRRMTRNDVIEHLRALASL